MKNKIIFISQLIFSCALILYVAVAILNYNKMAGSYILETKILLGKNFFFIDKFNICFLVLCIYIYILCLLYAFNFTKFSFKSNLIMLFIIEVLLILSFSTNNLLIFIILFESTIIPIFFYLGILGSRGRKINAMYLLFFFTMISSIFLFIGTFLLINIGGSLCFDQLQNLSIAAKERDCIIYLFLIGFAAKIPVMPLHIWLPEAHVEASTIGSVILAAIILKLGFYGTSRVMNSLNTFDFDIGLQQILIATCVCSIVYGCLLAVRQIDLKKIIAYSSIVHMNIGMIPLFSPSESGHFSALFLMLSHGLISAGMFFCIGFVYERFHVRNILYYGGLSQYMPIFSMLFLAIMLANMSVPGTCNFIGEFLALLNIGRIFNNFILGIVLLSTIFTSLFCILTFGRILFYQISGMLSYNLFDLNAYEIYIAGSLSFFIISMGLLPNLIFNLL